MRRSGVGSGGGIGNNKVVHRSAPKREPMARGVNPSAVNQLGNLVGDHVTHTGKSTGYRGEPLVRGPGYNPPQGPTSFNNVGPGKGRTLYGQSGSQGVHGGVASGSPRPNMQRDALDNK